MTPRPPTSTLFPYTTLFRSCQRQRRGGRVRSRSSHFALVPVRGVSRQSLLINPGELHESPPISHCLVGSIRSEEHTSELQSRRDLVCRLLLEKKKMLICISN